MSRAFFVALLSCLAVAASPGAQVPVSWQGLPTGTSTAVDAHGAAGPQGILELANQGITYYTKTGAQVWRTSEQSFLFGDTCCDAKGLFDAATQRFFVIAQSSSLSNLHVAVSLNAHPVSSGAGDWRKYVFPVGRVIDYPGIGVDAQALYASYGAGGSWLVLNKAQLLSGGTNATTMNRVAVPGGTQGLQAVTPIGSGSPGDAAYCVNMSSATSITLNVITSVLGTRTLFTTNIPAPSYGTEPLFSPQLGTATRLHAGWQTVMGNAFWRNGEIWFCNNVSSSNQPERTVTRWYKLNVGAFPNGQATLAEWGDLDGGPDTWHNHPSIGGNARGDVCVAYTQSSSNQFSSIRAAIRKAGEANFSEVVIRQSTAAFTQALWTNEQGLPYQRWADYCVVTPDPEDQTFWVNHLTIMATDSTSTWWGNVTRDSLFFVDKNAGGSEIGTRELPYHTVRTAHTAASGAKTFVIKPGSYPEPALPLRLDKNIRLENPYPSGTVHIGP